MVYNKLMKNGITHKIKTGGSHHGDLKSIITFIT